MLIYSQQGIYFDIKIMRSGLWQEKLKNLLINIYK